MCWQYVSSIFDEERFFMQGKFEVIVKLAVYIDK